MTGTFDVDTAAAIRGFQKEPGALLHPDGIVSRNGFTIRQLDQVSIPPLSHRVFSPVCWVPPGGTPTEADYKAAADNLGCELAAVKAVARTETQRSPWDPTYGGPSILFERHYFSRFTKNQFDRSHSDISNPASGGYGRYSDQYPKLRRAAMLDESAALQSASWGAFQIMGSNYAAAGFATVQTFVTAMMESELRQLHAFVAFVAANGAMKKALADKSWSRFAELYNGRDYRRNEYDTKLAANYAAAQ